MASRIAGLQHIAGCWANLALPFFANEFLDIMKGGISMSKIKKFFACLSLGAFIMWMLTVASIIVFERQANEKEKKLYAKAWRLARPW